MHAGVPPFQNKVLLDYNTKYSFKWLIFPNKKSVYLDNRMPYTSN
ncbi:hypothetical protein WVIC16_130027 [Weissella viridescens]|nr:hypothetical protein WVIC16_130027 [Weissella viridescens]